MPEARLYVALDGFNNSCKACAAWKMIIPSHFDWPKVASHDNELIRLFSLPFSECAGAALHRLVIVGFLAGPAYVLEWEWRSNPVCLPLEHA